MKTAALPVPGLLFGPYPERHDTAADPVATWLATLSARMPAARRHYRRAAGVVLQKLATLESIGDAAFRARVRGVQAAMSRSGLAGDVLDDTLALACRASVVALGKRPFPTQVMAARILIEGKLAEMATGEGKTLAAALCAATAALAGIPVHVITANDYLVTRDAHSLRPFYEALGLSVGAVTQPLQALHRRDAYGCDVTYCTAKELAFDYLRDGLMRGRPAASGHAPLLRGLCMAVIDEADSVLLDDACVPLVISERRESSEAGGWHRLALDLAASLEPETDFTLDVATMQASLKDAGVARLEADPRGHGAAWRNRIHREEAVSTALAALHLYRRDRHYVVRAGTVSLVDDATGRLASGRIWSRGLQQMVETLEDCKPSPETVTTAQITFQRFFQRYLSVCGMSGTLGESRAELQSVYGLAVVPVPLYRPDRRQILPSRLHANREDLWRAVMQEARAASAAGRPVLIGTGSVAESEALAQRFDAAGLGHSLLNARQDAAEAFIVGEAGQAGRITIATNMAGRGTDILLGPDVAARGGLHVINCQHNPSPRIDRQLIGRCARQGDPGSARTLLAADMPLLARGLPRFLCRWLARAGGYAPHWLLATAFRLPQWREEHRRRAQRRALLDRDLRTEQSLPHPTPGR